MQKIETLFRLQTLDLELEDKTRRLHEVESRLGESAELIAAREADAAAARAVHEAETALREREFEVSKVETKLKETNDILYSGKQRPAKELAGFQKEADLLKQHKSKGEDLVLEAMDRLESLQAARKEAQASLVRVEVEWREEQRVLLGQQEQLQAEIASLTGARDEVSQTVEPAHLHIYDTLRRQKAGRAVAKVEQSTCRGCRVVLPVSLVQKARTNPGLTFCGTCGRILYVSR